MVDIADNMTGTIVKKLLYRMKINSSHKIKCDKVKGIFSRINLRK